MSKNYTVMELEAIKLLCKSVNTVASLPSTVIADTSIATNTTYSSYKIDAEMSALENDIQAYVDTALAGLNKLTKEVIDDKALVVKENVLYLYKDPASADNNYMQMMLINGVVVELGTTEVNLDEYVTKTELESELGTERLGTTSQTVKGAINELSQSVTNNKRDTMDLENRVTTNETNITGLQEKIDNLDIPEDVTEINDKLTQLEKNQINKKTITDMSPTVSLYKITPSNVNNFSKILITDLYGGCILITGVPVDGYKSLKVVRLSNGNWNSYLPNDASLNKILNVYYDGSFIYVKFRDYVRFHVEGGFTNIEKITSNPTDSIQLPIVDLTQGSTGTVADVGVTTITPVNSAITGTIEYTVKNGICYVSMKDLMSTVSSTGLSISTTMPKPSINCNATLVSSSGNVALVYIDKATTKLNVNFYEKNVKSNCSFSYPVAE